MLKKITIKANYFGKVSKCKIIVITKLKSEASVI